MQQQEAMKDEQAKGFADMKERFDSVDFRLSRCERTGPDAVRVDSPESGKFQASREESAEIRELRRSWQAAEEAAEKYQAECQSLRASITAIKEAGECPILNDFSDDVVVASDGVSYDKRSIQEWQRLNGSSPLTREPLEGRLFPNRFAATVLRELRKCGLAKAPRAEPSEQATAPVGLQRAIMPPARASRSNISSQAPGGGDRNVAYFFQRPQVRLEGPSELPQWSTDGWTPSPQGIEEAGGPSRQLPTAAWLLPDAPQWNRTAPR